MSFPYSYTRKFEISNKKIEIDNLEKKINEISEKYKITEIKKSINKISLISQNTLAFFKFQIDITLEEDNKTLNFEIHIIDLLKISLLIVVVIPFFSNFSIGKILLFSGIIILIFYLANIMYINSFINKFSNFLITGTKFDQLKTEELSEQQKKWMNDKNRCSACGAPVLEYYTHCLDCAIKLNRKAKKSPFNTTNYNNFEIEYKFKETKKQKDV